MTTPHDPAAIAARLTDAQRRWLRAGVQPSGMGKWPVQNALVDKGLAQTFPYRLTPLGLAVRHHLENGDKA